MGKHSVLYKVVIDSTGKVLAFNKDGESIKLSRSQFIALARYKSDNYTYSVYNVFTNKSLLGKSFHVHDERNDFTDVFTF